MPHWFYWGWLAVMPLIMMALIVFLFAALIEEAKKGANSAHHANNAALLQQIQTDSNLGVPETMTPKMDMFYNRMN